MNIRTFRAGDEAQQVSIYNEAGADLPKFKVATLDEVRRRCAAADFDPSSRFYAEVGGRVVGYATLQANGRVSFPWFRKGQQEGADELFSHVLAQAAARGLTKVFAAYRGDWPAQRDFFLRHGFVQAREMVNFVLDMVEMPTPAARSSTISPVTPADLPAVLRLGAGVLRVTDPAALEAHLFHNPYFPPASLFALRKGGGDPVAIGLGIANPSYGDPNQVDPAMPCFRLGAFGTEGLTVKRLTGMFSFLAADDRDIIPLALDLMGWAAIRLEEDEVESLAAQVASDAHLFRFYRQHFRRQGSFPIYERDLEARS